ncbi:hypothetical protein OPKNFCMD_5469 [Methylobacterium crusticola]|uniref:DNA-binding protein n=1 Tax=Methylobacterium crusticola TaxID=1697972 RepID=A0ABQ4R4S6_9HYPH|nr:hypothetical protein [Methylobacterium crusticola]GJD52703.1 hypothetical protein OPKNFCMD_5469 [Methylobacterium crusticola]
MTRPRVLIPYDPAEAISIGEAAFLARRSASTVRGWAARFHIGRRIAGGAWMVSAPALLMLLDDDHEALDAYLAGERGAEAVRAYFVRAVVPCDATESAEATKSAKAPVLAVVR